MRWPKFLRKDNPAYRAIFATDGGKGPAWKTVDLASYLKEGYQRCVTSFACVNLIAKSASRVSWTLSKKAGKGNWNEFDEHPCLDLLSRPNEFESGIRFGEKVFSYLPLAGNVYIYRNSGIPSAPPARLYVFRPDRVTVNKSGDWRDPIASYDYNAGAKPETIDKRLVLHLTEFHPTDDWYGLSKIEVCARQVDILNEAAIWNMKIIQKDMRIPGVLTGKTAYDPETFMRMWTENYSGPESSRFALPLLFEGEDLKWYNISVNPKDIDWVNGQKLVLRQICSVFGVPSQLLGDTEATTYANYQEARASFYHETVLPLMDIYRDELNNWLVPLYGSGLRLDYNRDGIEAIQEDRGKKYAYLNSAEWLTINEKRDETGFDEIEGGDVILVPISDIPLEEATAPPEPAPDFTPDDDADPDADPDAQDEPPAKARKPARRVIKAVKKSFWTDPDRQKALWTNFDTRTRTREKSFLELARKYLERQGNDIKARLAGYSALVNVSPAALLDKHAETDRFVKDFKAWYRDHFIRAGNAGMHAAKGELFNDAEFKDDKPSSWVFNMTPAQEARLSEHIFNTGSKVNDTTIEKIYRELQRAQVADMTIDEFGQALGDKLDDLSRSRARLWAQNESVWTDSYGQNEAFKQTEFVDMKGWLSAFLDTSRDDHMAASGQEVGVNESFKIGAYMQEFPGDGSQGAPVEDTIQCKCSIYPVIGPGTGD
jgi:HK97 family phage portal protein